MTKLISLYFRTNKEIEKVIVQDATENFNNNYSEAVRNRLAKRYGIEIKPRVGAGSVCKNKKANIRVTRVEQDIVNAVENDAKMLYEGNASQAVRIGLISIYREIGMIE